MKSSIASNLFGPYSHGTLEDVNHLLLESLRYQDFTVSRYKLYQNIEYDHRVIFHIMKRRNDRKLKYKDLSCVFFMDHESREVIIFILVYFY